MMLRLIESEPLLNKTPLSGERVLVHFCCLCVNGCKVGVQD